MSATEIRGVSSVNDHLGELLCLRAECEEWRQLAEGLLVSLKQSQSNVDALIACRDELQSALKVMAKDPASC